MDDSNAGRRDVIIDRQAMRDARTRGALPAFGGPWFGGLEKDVAVANRSRLPFVRDADGHVQWVSSGLRLIPRSEG